MIVQTGAIIRGDLANVRVGRFCIISKNAVIRPLYKQFSKGYGPDLFNPCPFNQLFPFRVAFFPLHIGDHVFIGENSIVSATSVGSYVHIGSDVVIVREIIVLPTQLILTFVICPQGRRCILKDCCIIEDGAVLPPETTVASFMKFTKKGTIEGGQGNPDFVPPGMQDLMIDYTKSYYEHFIPLPN